LAAPHPLRPPPSPTPDSPHPAAAAPPPSTLSLHDALPIWGCVSTPAPAPPRRPMLRRSASPAPCVAAVAARPPGSVLWGRAPWGPRTGPRTLRWGTSAAPRESRTGRTRAAVPRPRQRSTFRAGEARADPVSHCVRDRINNVRDRQWIRHAHRVADILGKVVHPVLLHQIELLEHRVVLELLDRALVVEHEQLVQHLQFLVVLRRNVPVETSVRGLLELVGDGEPQSLDHVATTVTLGVKAEFPGVRHHHGRFLALQLGVVLTELRQPLLRLVDQLLALVLLVHGVRDRFDLYLPGN